MALECLRNTTHCQEIPGAADSFTATKLASSETSLQQASSDMQTQLAGFISSGVLTDFMGELNANLFVSFLLLLSLFVSACCPFFFFFGFLPHAGSIWLKLQMT